MNPTVFVVMGTRPEAIKLAPVVEALRTGGRLEPYVVGTFQHREMLAQALRPFGIAADADLDVMTEGQTPTRIAAEVMRRLEPLIAERRPAWVVVQGDTTSTMAAAIAAFYGGVRVAHVEAGLRTGRLDSPFPEEFNRRSTTVATALHFAPTERAARALRAEGVREDAVMVVGNTIVDAVRRIRAGVGRASGAGGLTVHEPASGKCRLEACTTIEAQTTRGQAELGACTTTEAGTTKVASSTKWAGSTEGLQGHCGAGFQPAPQILVTLHRRESFGEPIERVLRALRRVAEAAPGGVHIVLPVHPNPNVAGPVRRALAGVAGVELVPPMDYPAFLDVFAHSRFVISDSGGVQEEAPALGVPVLITREVTERPEVVESGWGRIVGTDEDAIVAEATRLLADDDALAAMKLGPNPFGDGHAAERIALALAERV